MMRKCKLGKLLDVTRGVSLAGAYCVSEGERVRLTLANFDYVNNCFQEDRGKDNLFYSKEVPRKFILDAGSIITPLTEQTPGLLGSTARIPESGKYIQSQDVGLIKPFEDVLDHDFAYYLVSSKGVKDQLAARSQQTKIRHTSPDKIKDCTVFVPDLPDQRKIGKFFSSIDRMIELSRKRIENLEKLAKEIYDYWFVQFDFPDKRGEPYKSSGGKMVYNADLKREIPEEWEMKRFGDLICISEGQVNPQKMGDQQLEHYSIPAYDDACYPVMEKAHSILSNKFKVTAETFLVSKLNPQFKRLWDPMCVTADAVCSTEFIVCRSKDEINKPFNYGVADSEAFQIYMRQRSSSSTGSRKRLDPKDILDFKLAMPLDDGLLDKFNKLAGECLAMIKESRKGVHELTQLREFLLPLLMNGQAKMEG